MVHFEEVSGYGSLGVLEGDRRAPLGADIDTTEEVLSSGVLEDWAPPWAGTEVLSSGVLAALSPSVAWGSRLV